MDFNSFGADEDVIEVELMPNGIIRVTTDPISGANHSSAEGLLDTITKLAGGGVVAEPRHDKHTHAHHHGHTHLHN